MGRVIGGSSSQSFHHRRPGNQRKPSEICAHQLLFNSALSAQQENKFHCKILTYCLVSAAAELGMNHFCSLLIFPLLLLTPPLPMQTKGRRLLAWSGQSSTLVLSKIFCTNIFSRVSFSRGIVFEQGHYFARFYAYKHHICVFPNLLLRKNDIITLGMCFK